MTPSELTELISRKAKELHTTVEALGDVPATLLSAWRTETARQLIAGMRVPAEFADPSCYGCRGTGLLMGHPCPCAPICDWCGSLFDGDEPKEGPDGEPMARRLCDECEEHRTEPTLGEMAAKEGT